MPDLRQPTESFHFFELVREVKNDRQGEPPAISRF